MSDPLRTEEQIKSWLRVLLEKEDFTVADVKILGGNQKGEGYMGDVVFVEAIGSTKDGTQKKYDLVLKCSKTSKALRETSPVREAFLNEIFVYKVVFPTFLEFQRKRKVDKLFDKAPKCYGTLVTDDVEVLALENLKTKGYFMWDKRKPFTRQHIDMVMDEYSRLHAVSIAMNDQEPDKFRQLAEQLNDDMCVRMTGGDDMISILENLMVEVYDLLKNHLDDGILEKWVTLKEKVRFTFSDGSHYKEGFTVILHGDCWSNNYMHYHVNDKPTTFAMLDWQLSRCTSPILDLAYFLFSCISQEDINDIEFILKSYHCSLMEQTRKLGTQNPDRIYPMDQFLSDWKKFSKYGFIIATIIHKFALSEQDEAPDMAEAADNGEGFATTFSRGIRNLDAYRKRIIFLVKYIVENDLI